MIIDHNPNEREALRLLALGKVEQSHAIEDDFLREAFRAGHCTCPEKGCRWHGNCRACVVLHRGADDHLPYCMHEMINRRLSSVLRLTESVPTHIGFTMPEEFNQPEK